MKQGKLASDAWTHYAEQIKRDPGNLYYCYRVLERAHLFMCKPGGGKLLRQAARTVFRKDPLAFVTSYHFSAGRELSAEDLEEIAGALKVKGDKEATQFLRGIFWANCTIGRKGKLAKAWAKAGRACLERVSADRAAAEPEFLPSLARCYLLTDYKAYKQLSRPLFESREPEWRGHELIDFLRAAASHKDWSTYAQWRGEWDQLPVNAHLCECSLNELYTMDGLKALHEGRLEAIPDCLRKAVDVRGCPHLNSGTARLHIIDRLAKRKLLPTESLAYLDACEKLCADDKRLAPLRARIINSAT